MARKLGYGGLANTNGARDFTGKTPASGVAVVLPLHSLISLGAPMAIRNQALTVNFLAWNTSNNAGQTGDSGNFTMRLIKDGAASAALTNALSEPDSTNMPGTYEVALTATEMDANFVTLHGISSTSNVVIFPLHIATERGNIATVDTVVDGIQTDLDNGTDGLGAIKTAVDAIPTSNPSAATIADSVWDEARSGHTTAGSFGEHTNADVIEWAGNVVTASGGNPDVNVETIDTGAISSTSFSAGALDAAALAADAVDEILDEQIGDGTLTMRETLRVMIAAMAGKLSGAATTTVTIRNDADTANVIVATVDADGNRSAVTLTP